MSDRIDVGKLRGIYYNNDKDVCRDTSSLMCVKHCIADDAAFAVNAIENDFNDIEVMIVDYIKAMPVADYNDLSNKNSKILADIETYTNLINIIAIFADIASLSTIILIYCDYFSLKYERVISELPNGLKIKLYDELKMHTRNKEILNKLFGFNSNNVLKPLF